MPHPRLRPVDAYPIDNEGQTFFVLRDPEGVTEGAVMLSPAAFIVATMLDGERDTAGVQAEFAKRYEGSSVNPEEVEDVVRELDSRFLLESEVYKNAQKKMCDDFAAAKTRAAYHAGQSYEPTAEGLEKQLKEFYTSEEGAGEPFGGAQGKPADKRTTDVRGILAPHIDFHRGGTCYTYAYRRLTESCDADLFVILGVAHSSPPSPFVLTGKDYDTPFGPAGTDQSFVDRLRKRMGSGAFEHELVHRTEHSAEFQTVFLKHALNGREFEVVPILCSSFEPYCGKKSPSTVGQIEDSIQALGEAIRESGKKVCIVGGVDFAHVGPRFGDAKPVTPKLIKWMEGEDKVSIGKVEEGDAEGFWESVMADNNKRKVCGLTAVYTALRILSPVKGKLLKYGYAPDPAGGIVSFASVEFGSK